MSWDTNLNLPKDGASCSGVNSFSHAEFDTPLLAIVQTPNMELIECADDGDRFYESSDDGLDDGPPFRQMSPGTASQILAPALPSVLGSIDTTKALPPRLASSILASKQIKPSSILQGLNSINPVNVVSVDEAALVAELRQKNGLTGKPAKFSGAASQFLRTQLLRVDQLYTENEFRIQTLDRELSVAKSTLARLSANLQAAKQVKKRKYAEADAGPQVVPWSPHNQQAQSQAGGARPAVTVPCAVTVPQAVPALHVPALVPAGGQTTPAATTQGTLKNQYLPNQFMTPQALAIAQNMVSNGRNLTNGTATIRQQQTTIHPTMLAQTATTSVSHAQLPVTPTSSVSNIAAHPNPQIAAMHTAQQIHPAVTPAPTSVSVSAQQHGA